MSEIQSIETLSTNLTVFGVTKSSGEFDGDYVWRYVPNERISFLKLEKVIFDITSINNEKKIGANKEEIQKIKEKEVI